MIKAYAPYILVKEIIEKDESTFKIVNDVKENKLRKVQIIDMESKYTLPNGDVLYFRCAKNDIVYIKGFIDDIIYEGEKYFFILESDILGIEDNVK